MIMDDSTSIHERRKLVKTNKNVLHGKQTVFAEVCSKNASKMIKRWSRKTATDVKITPQNKGERREGENCFT